MECRFLKPDEQTERRSIADAIEVLRSDVHFCEGDKAKISIAAVPVATRAASIAVRFDTQVVTSLILLPAARQFRACQAGELRRHTWDVGRLQAATVYGEGTVELTNGTRLKSVEVIPARLPYDLSAFEYRILKHALAAAGVKEDCVCRSIRAGVPQEFRQTVPDLRALDFRKLAQVRAPSFKRFQRYIDQNALPLGLSRQKYHETLTKAGIGLQWRRGRPRAASTTASSL